MVLRNCRLPDLHELGHHACGRQPQFMLAVIETVFTDVVFQTPGFNGKAAFLLCPDHLQPLLVAYVGSQLIHVVPPVF